MLPILYTFRRCPYAMRARTALVYAGVEFEPREVDLKNKPAELLSISPKGTVPVLQFPDGEIIEESLDIMIWALEKSDRNNILNAADQSEQEALIDKCQSDFTYHLYRYKYPERFEPKVDAILHRNSCLEFLKVLEGLLKEQDFIYGNAPSLADMAIYPFIRQFSIIEPDWYEENVHASIQAWLQRWLCVKDFETIIMAKYPVWSSKSK